MAVATDRQPDYTALKPTEMVRWLNSTGAYGTVTNTRRVYKHRNARGLALGGHDTLHVLKYVAYLANEVHGRRARGPEPEQLGDAERMREKRATQRDIEIPGCKNPRRRRKALRDIYYFLPTYFPEWYSGPFTSTRKQMVEAIRHSALHKVDQSLLAPRGDGKTTTFRGVLMEAIIQGHLKFPLLVGKSLEYAQDQLLDPIKFAFETYEELHEDFPEICAPIRALEGAPARANMQTVAGVRTHMVWSKKHIILPAIAGSKASGAIIAARGADQPIRGTNYRGHMRPDLAAIDDPDTEETADSERATNKIVRLVDQSIGGLAPAGEDVARIFLGTALNRRCSAWIFTDRKLKPSFKGIRIPLMKTFPKRMDLWDRYVDMRTQADENDPNRREAFDFLVANYEEMHVGAEVSNETRHVTRLMDDGRPKQLSTVQYYFDELADKGPTYVATELQNNPPEEEEEESIGLDARLIQQRISGTRRRIVPDSTTELVGAIDLGAAKGCNWSMMAMQPGFTGVCIDYGVQDVYNIRKLTDEVAIENALEALWEDLQAEPYRRENGEVVPISLIMVDSGNWSKLAYRFVARHGRPFRLFKGFGSRHKQSPFKNVLQKKKDSKGRAIRLPGDNYYQSWLPDARQWLVCGNTDHWLPFVHRRLAMETLTEAREGVEPKLRRGSFSLFEPEVPQQHVAIAHHLIAQYLRNVITPKGEKLEWVTNSRQNDWLDTWVMICVAARLRGITLLQSDVARDRSVRAEVKKTRSYRQQAPRRRRSNYATSYKR